MLIAVVYFLKSGLTALKKMIKPITTRSTMNFCPPSLAITDLFCVFGTLFLLMFSSS